MIKITIKKFNSIHNDFKHKWSNENNPELIGKWIAIKNPFLRRMQLPTTGTPGLMLIEGIDFMIIDKPIEKKL